MRHLTCFLFPELALPHLGAALRGLWPALGLTELSHLSLTLSSISPQPLGPCQLPAFCKHWMAGCCELCEELQKVQTPQKGGFPLKW